MKFYSTLREKWMTRKEARESLSGSSGSEIRFFQNPTEDLCRAAVKSDISAVSLIEDPDLWMCIQAIRRNPEYIEYPRYQPYDMCIFAILRNPYMIQYIKDPTLELCLLAVILNSNALEYINNPAYEVNRAAIAWWNEQVFFHMRTSLDVSQDLGEFAVKKHDLVNYKPSSVRPIELSESLSKAVARVKAKIAAGQEVSYSPEIQAYLEEVNAIRKDPERLLTYNDPSIELQIHAVIKHPSNLKYIKNPSVFIRMLAALYGRNGHSLDLNGEKDWSNAEMLTCCTRWVTFLHTPLEYPVQDLEGTPEQIQAFHEAVLNNCPYLLEKLEDQTEYLCSVAIKSWPGALQYVKNKTFDLCVLAATWDGEALKYVPAELFDRVVDACGDDLDGYDIEAIRKEVLMSETPSDQSSDTRTSLFS